MLHNNLLYY